MTDSNRLILEGTPRERALLQSARQDRPGPAFRDRLLMGLAAAGAITATTGAATAGAATAGAATAGATTAGATTAGATAGTTAGATGLGAAAGPAGALAGSTAAAGHGVHLLGSSWVIAKWVGIGICSGLAVTSTAQWAASPRSATAPEAAPSLNQPEQLRSGAKTQPTLLARRTLQAPAPLPAEPSRAAPEPSVTGEAPGRHRVTEEIAILDQARAALRSGDPSRALTALQDYQTQFSKSATLAPEAELVALEALRARGDHNAVIRQARVFLQVHPGSPLTARVRSLLDIEIHRESGNAGLSAGPSATAMSPANNRAPEVSRDSGKEATPGAARFPDAH